MSERPTSPNILGILSIVFGSIVVALTLMAFGFDPMDSPMVRDVADLGRALDVLKASLEPWATLSSIAMLIMGASLIGIGIGQRGYRRWARSAAVGWSVVALVITAGQALNQILVVNPALERFMDDALPGSLGRQLMGSQGVGALILLVLLYVPYPAVQLVLMRRRDVVLAMTA